MFLFNGFSYYERDNFQSPNQMEGLMGKPWKQMDVNGGFPLRHLLTKRSTQCHKPTAFGDI